MRLLRSGVLLTAVLGLLAFVGCKSKEQTEKEKAELKKLEGKWKIASREGDKSDPDADDEGEKPADKDDKGVVFVIEGDILTEKFDNEPYARRRITINPSKEPAHIDMVRLELKEDKPITYKVKEKKKGKTTTKTRQYKEVGIYKLEGDKLTITSKFSDSGRPSEFKASGSGIYTMVLEKVGAKAEQ